MGPTASGKTAAALKLADVFDVELISVDSALVYKGMDIGTAKPDAETLKKYPHHLIDIREPWETYSVAEFRNDALGLISEIQARNKIPLLVGGTMLYFRSLEQGITPLPSADAIIREQLQQRLHAQGLAALHEELQTCDPRAAARIHPNDPQRILRALEVFTVSGKCLSDWWDEQAKSALPFEAIKIVVSPDDRAVLHQRIEQRFDQMLAQDFLDEARQLFAEKHLHAELPSMRSVGYRQAWMFLCGKLNESEFRQKAVVATRQLAKRQLTWLRSEQNSHWFDSQSGDFVTQIIQFLDSKGIKRLTTSS